MLILIPPSEGKAKVKSSDITFGETKFNKNLDTDGQFSRFDLSSFTKNIAELLYSLWYL